ncbi:MAG: hypothetical protein RLY14_477 [Planctomycetota bacterium]
MHKKLILRSVLTMLGVMIAATLAMVWFRGPVQRTQRWKQISLDASKAVEPQVRLVDSAFNRWSETEKVSLAKQADWLTVCRRLALGLVGSGMSLEEIRHLEQWPESERAVIYTEYLLSDRRWSDYFSERLTRAFVGTEMGPFLLFRRRKFREWLEEQLSQEKGMDSIATRLIESEGLWMDRPEVNFITATIPPGGARKADVVRLAGRTSRVFLGLRLDCLECHNDFVDKTYFPEGDKWKGGTQEDFHELAAFFAGATLAENALLGVREEKLDYRFKYLDAKEEVVVKPSVPFAEELLPEVGKPRERLAKWLTDSRNPAFSRAVVNRFWAIVTGKPLVDPVDDIPLNSEVPEPLQILSDDFAQNGFNIKRLLRIIASTDAFRRSSRLEGDEVTMEQQDCWAVFPITQLRPEQVAGQIIQASQLKTVDRDSVWVTQLARFGQINDFLKAYGDLGEDELSPENETIPQRLLLLNGQMVRERTRHDPVANPISRIADQASGDVGAVENCFLAVLNRRPSQDELDYFVAKLEGLRFGARQKAVSDLCWVLMNTTEFLWNH